MADRAASRPWSVTLRNRVRYHFDNLLSRGTWAVLVFLGAVTFVALLVSSLLLAVAGVTFTGSEGGSFLEDLWQSMLRVIDPGTMAGDVGWGQRLLALVVTVFGILIAGTLIGLIASGVEQRVDAMQRGRSPVVESGHVLILGASAKLPVIVDQLTLAGRRTRRNTIVVMADREPRGLGESVRSFVTDTGGSRLVFRQGDPTRRADLAVVAADRARVVIALANEDADGDAGVVKTVLAVGAELGGFDRIPIVAELNDPGTAESLTAACGGQVYPLVPSQGIARITAFTLREPGLNQVVEELLDYRGADIYVRDLGDLSDSTFADSVYHFAKIRPIGRMSAKGDVELNPSPRAPFLAGDRLVVIADDGRASSAVSTLPIRTALSDPPKRVLKKRMREETFLIVGWNKLGRRLLDHLAQIATPGSSAEVVYDSRLFERDELALTGTEELSISLTASRSDVWAPESREQLAGITSVVFLGYRRMTSIEEADSRTLLNLMLLNRAVTQYDLHRPRVVAELLNADNVDVARTTGADDFVVSDAITSRLIAQLAEQPERRPVLQSLYAPEGPSINLLEANELGMIGQLGWHQVIDTAYSAGLLAVGWRRPGSGGGEVVLNPHEDQLFNFQPDDQVVVIG